MTEENVIHLSEAATTELVAALENLPELSDHPKRVAKQHAESVEVLSETSPKLRLVRYTWVSAGGCPGNPGYGHKACVEVPAGTGALDGFWPMMCAKCTYEFGDADEYEVVQ